MRSRDQPPAGEGPGTAEEDAFAATAATVDDEAGYARTKAATPEMDARARTATDGEPSTARAAPLASGATLGRYTIVSTLGEGGMGVVYAAHDPDLDRDVALKILHASAGGGSAPGDARARLLREARAMAKLRHPNVITVYEVGTVGDTDFVAMELVDGPTLAGWMNKLHRWREVVDVFIGAGRGLVAAHDAGLVHRDFKPANVLMSGDGTAIVTDFGLARSRPDERALAETLPGTGRAARSARSRASTRRPAPGASGDASGRAGGSSEPLPALTRTGAVVGTPAYMAPEQHLGRAADERSDQFSFCVALYEALYGRRPFAGDSLAELRRAVTSGRAAEAPRWHRVPAAVRHALMRGLRPDPSQRYRSMEALLSELSRTRRRRGWRSVFAVVAVAAIVAAGALTVVRRSGSAAGAGVCGDGATDLRGVWDGNAKAAVRAAFASAGGAAGSSTYGSVAGILDRYAASWRQAYAGTCRQTYVAHKRSEADFYLSRQCLLRRRHALDALVKVFRRADKRTVQNAVEGAQELEPVAGCLDVNALRAGVPPPKDPRTRKAVAGLRADLADIDALLKADRFKEGLASARAAVARARKLGYQPVLGEALLRLGRLDREVDDATDARKAFKEADYIADVASDDALRARALVGEVKTEVAFSSDTKAMLKRAVRAEAAVRRYGGDPALAAKMKATLARVYIERGRASDFHHADTLLADALATDRRALGPDDTRVADLLEQIGALRQRQRRYRAALALRQQALAIDTKRLGPDHPDVVEATELVAGSLQFVGRYDQARATYAKVAGFLGTPVARRLLEIGRALMPKRVSGALVRGRVVDERGRPVSGATVVVGPRVVGDGKFVGGLLAGLNGRQSGVRRGVTGADGRFAIDDVDKGTIVAVAEKGSVGRSWPVVLAEGKQRSHVALPLRRYGSARGRVTGAGEAPTVLMASAIPEIASARKRGPAAPYAVAVAVDRSGQFSFERLAAGDYRIVIQAVLRARAELFLGRNVTIPAGGRQTIDFDFPGGPALTVTVLGPKRTPVPAASVALHPGGKLFRTMAAFNRAVVRDTSGCVYAAPALHGAPALLRHVAPGRYAMCVTAFSRDIKDPKLERYLLSRGADLPTRCRRVEVAATPAKQTLTFTAHHLVDPAAARR